MPQAIDMKRAQNYPAEVFSGIIIGLVILIDSVSMAALVFSGNLAGHLTTGIGIFLLSSIAVGLIVGLSSPFSSNIAHPKSIAGAVSSVIAASAVAGLSDLPSQVMPTILFTIAFTTLLTGISFFVMGKMRLGNLTRFIPYPVIGGFLGGTGWLIVRGAFTVITQKAVTITDLPFLLKGDMLRIWLPGLVLGAVLLFIQRGRKNFILIPAVMLVASLVFYAILMTGGYSIGEAFGNGWMIGPLPHGNMWEPLNAKVISGVNWRFVLDEFGNILTIVFLSSMSILLNYSGLEFSAQYEFDLNHELRITGVANIVTSLLGGTVGFNSPIFCVFKQRVGSRTRLPIILTALLCGLSLFYGARVFAYVPRFIVGGFLLYLGMGLLFTWLYDTFNELSRLDYALVLTIVLMIAGWGLIEGVMTGILFAIIIFIVNYSRIDVVRHGLSGTSYRSNVERSIAEEDILSKEGESIYIMGLQGYIFFGTAHGILEKIRERIADTAKASPAYIILDMKAVTGMDSSALMSFRKIRKIAVSNGITMLLSRVPGDIKKRLERRKIIRNDDQTVIAGLDLDHSLEWCEDRVLEQASFTKGEGVPLEDFLNKVLPGADKVEAFRDYLERVEVPAGHILFRQGDQPDEIYYIENGKVNVQFELNDGRVKRLASMQAGALVGEMGLFTGLPRSATVVTARPCVLYRLSIASLQKMQERDPALLSYFQEFIVKLLTKRLAHSNNLLNMLLK